jgi:hypothetical protein
MSLNAVTSVNKRLTCTRKAALQLQNCMVWYGTVRACNARTEHHVLCPNFFFCVFLLTSHHVLKPDELSPVGVLSSDIIEA